MTFGDHQSLSTSYDNRMRPTSWNVSSVLGYNYSYIEHADRVNYARNVYDSTLDRSYEYDQVGALVFAHSGAEARAAFGIDGQQWGTSDGPYSHMYNYDKQGNMIQRFGWGGEVQGGHANGGDTTLNYGYTNNRIDYRDVNNTRTYFGYDASGNMTSDGGQTYTYDATGQQANANGVTFYYYLIQGYDGNGLRVAKTENGYLTFYLRSTVLGGAAICEIDGNGVWSRGNVYAGDDLLAVQQNGEVDWVHEDPITKSQRVTNASGSVINMIELDPWGANTNRSSASAFQPQTFNYTIDANGGFDAKHRRYSATGRFSQPDPYAGSYDFADPQSLNRYAYTKNDPVNFRDPSGLGLMSILRAIGHWLGRANEGPNGIGGSGGGDMVVVLGNPDEDGGGGGDPQKAYPDQPTIAAALDRCLQGKFLNSKQTGPAVNLVSFDPSAPGHSGSTTVDYIDKSAPGQTGVYKINNDVTTYTRATLPKGARGAQGFTRPNSPFINFTISDVEKHRAKDPVLDNIVGGFIATQIHELGNSIDYASGNFIGDTRSRVDKDSGYQLEQCVASELLKQGFNGK